MLRQALLETFGGLTVGQGYERRRIALCVTVGGKVRDEVLQYLGSEKKVPRADAAEAVAFWNKWVKQRKARKGGRANG